MADPHEFSEQEVLSSAFNKTTKAIKIDGGGATDETAATPGSTSATLIAAVADETSPDSVSEGVMGYLRMTLTRFLKVSFGDLLSGEDQTNNVLATVREPLAVATHAWTQGNSSALEGAKVVKAAPGTLRHVSGFNSKLTGQFIHVINASSLVVSAVPSHILYAAPTATFDYDFGEDGLYMSNGITLANSSVSSYNISGSADVFFTSRFK